MTDRQRTKIAAGRVSGKTSREIAAETNLSESAVRKQAADPRTKTLIQRLKERDETRLSTMWTLALNSIQERLLHQNPSIQCDATRDLYRFLNAGDPPLARLDPVDDKGGDFTLEELLTVYRRF
ncbi:MAG: hypothetical protein ACRD30_05560 [Bryobacteraceae bacterium]